ncbi:polyhydroxyalkanoic acid system family protein [Parvularcula dongshanensis]|uniref:Putative polyhydroxyalkanoate system protein n=1 Tax=Parvularcula dongshanensis TaxID=1173995 RepID=A0A840I1N0_9PROT|nr:polyhydroxyalkanoic acid system family protein [Parvularcula dongshanensis]MBB4658098.1 putative polyhydroxyalkanoate system protein [Parvularcula dongshanensis]
MARPVTVTISHEHSKEEARRRLDEGIGKLTSQFGSLAKVKHDWRGDTLDFKVRAMMQSVNGNIDVFDDYVRITVVLPDLLAGMAEKVTNNIQKQGQILLEKK